MKILIGISGGFDSAYATRLLQTAGHTVEGAVLEMHGYTEILQAKEVAKSLDIPLHVISCHALFDRCVIDDFCAAYSAGKTPNPCIVCNEKVKFRTLYDYAMANGFDRIATGHYAKVVEQEGRYAVAMAKDTAKDQSYMLYRLPQEILKKLIFPLSDIVKKDARADAMEKDFVASDREESQEICFVRGESYADYIARRCGEAPEGDFIDTNGNLLGKHKGIIHYTVGQRKGLGISAKTRLFIQKIDLPNNAIILSDCMPQVKQFSLADTCNMGRTVCEGGQMLLMRARYSAPLTPAYVWKENGVWQVRIEKSTCAITPGQSAVFYRESTVVFGGIIDQII